MEIRIEAMCVCVCVKSEMINHSNGKKKKNTWETISKNDSMNELYFTVVYIKDYRGTIERKSRYAACVYRKINRGFGGWNIRCEVEGTRPYKNIIRCYEARRKPFTPPTG